jgi:hypothetical protein
LTVMSASFSACAYVSSHLPTFSRNAKRQTL